MVGGANSRLVVHAHVLIDKEHEKAPARRALALLNVQTRKRIPLCRPIHTTGLGRSGKVISLPSDCALPAYGRIQVTEVFAGPATDLLRGLAANGFGYL